MVSSTGTTLKTHLANWLQARLPTRESRVVAGAILLIFQLSYLAAFYLRSELLLKPSDTETIEGSILWVLAAKLFVFWSRGLCHRPLNSAHFADLTKLVQASTASLLVLIAMNYFGGMFPGWTSVPRAVLLLDWAFTILGVGGMQAALRSVYEEVLPATAMGSNRGVLVIDASPSGRRLAASIAADRHGDRFVAGLLDDDPATYGVQVGHAKVLGPISMAPACAERLRVGEIVVVQGALYGSRLRSLCDACAAIGARLSVAEAATPDGAAATTTRHRIRNIELRDLPARPPAALGDDDANVLPFLADKTVLVTGAGGSIGAEICRQVMRFKPRKLILVERSECGLFSIHRELSAAPHDACTQLVPALCDVTDAERIDRILESHKPHIVFHAAAYKHVPLLESHAIEAIENNTLATATMAERAEAHGVRAFVALSTDKAVYPSSVMGASKLVAERVLQAFDGHSQTRFVVVRFGNVLGSSGSAVPIFTEQLARRLPITITHEDVRRYFMTIDEAAQLVLLAGGLADRGGTFVLDMGEPMRIVDLVSSLAFVMGVPPEQVRIQYCGLRPGEKLDEALFFEDERREPTRNPLVIRVTRRPRELRVVRHWLAELRTAVTSGDDVRSLLQLQRIVAEDCDGIASLHAGPDRDGVNAPPTTAAHPAGVAESPT
ncbi:MAG: polysaccharide biosynthesis protein [Actinomycetota bacterium]